MTNPVAYIIRDDFGGRLLAARLVSDQSDDHWSGQAFDSHEVANAAEDLAEWISTRLQRLETNTLAYLCIDPDGSACSWMNLPDTSPQFVKAAIESSANFDDEDDLDQDDQAATAVASRFPTDSQQITFEALAESSQRKDPSPRALQNRVSVLAVPKASPNLLLDALDRRKVHVQRVGTLWHAASAAWDPAGPSSDKGAGHHDASIVASHAPLSATIIIDPISERLVWAWSDRGALVAAGSMRLRTAVDKDVQRLGLDAVGETDQRAVITDAEVGRLTNDWLAWSAQIGQAPERILCIGSPSPIGDEGLSPKNFGEILSARWPNASVQLKDEPDAIAQTLNRLLAIREHLTPGSNARDQLDTLTNRPNSALRGLYRWAAVALVAASVGLLFIAYTLTRRTANYASQTLTTITETRAQYDTVDPELFRAQIPSRELQNRVNEKRALLSPADLGDRERPVVEVLDAITHVVAAPGIELSNITIDAVISVQVQVPDIATAEFLAAALQNIDGPKLNWTAPQPRERRGPDGTDVILVTYSATWGNN